MLKSAALIRNGTVVNVAVYDEDTSGPWLDAVRTDYDEVRIVDAAGIGWTVEADGLRPPSPFPSWSWDGAAWQPPTLPLTVLRRGMRTLRRGCRSSDGPADDGRNVGGRSARAHRSRHGSVEGFREGGGGGH